MEYLIEPMQNSGIICKSAGCSPETCECYKAIRNCVYVPVCKIDVCNCEGGREGCGWGGRSPEFRSLPPVI